MYLVCFFVSWIYYNKYKTWCECNINRILTVCIYILHRCVNKSSWEEAEQSFPAFTDEKRLRTFVGLPTKGGVPQPLKDYCEAAKKSTKMSDADQTVQTVTKDGSMAIFVPGSFKSVSGDGLISKIPTYKGVKLIIACIDDVSVTVYKS